MEKITLTIIFDQATSQVAVNGPIQNRMLCYAMLKLAEKAIDENYEREQEKVKASGVIPVRGNGRDIINRLRG
jgi:hypothetical protein